MNVAFVTSEAVPHAKTGGLADVAGTLPRILNKLGVTSRIYLPRYKDIKGTFLETLRIDLGAHTLDVNIYEHEQFVFVDYPAFFDRDGLYGTEKGDFTDNCERFTLFCKAVTKLILQEHYDIVHCHDWQSGMILLYLREKRRTPGSVFTIHNIGYQGRFPAAKFSLLGIEGKYFTPEGIEYYGDINFLKAGIVYADVITTVSPTYAQEIQTPEFGFGLDGILRTRSENIAGIINGIDYGQWNAAIDPLIHHPYCDFSGKSKNKEALIQDCALREGFPLIGMVSRIADQKGFDILLKAFSAIMAMGYNMIILGFGDTRYHAKLKELEMLYPHRVSIHIKFDNKMAHRIYAGSDFFLMPSRYEPCGLGQLISLKYGTVPVVRKTGGLADTIQDFSSRTQQGNGFVFEEYSGQALLDVLQHGYDVYQQSEIFERLSEHCMTYDFSWEASARKYIALYQSLIAKCSGE